MRAPETRLILAFPATDPSHKWGYSIYLGEGVGFVSAGTCPRCGRAPVQAGSIQVVHGQSVAWRGPQEARRHDAAVGRDGPPGWGVSDLWHVVSGNRLGSRIFTAAKSGRGVSP